MQIVPIVHRIFRPWLNIARLLLEWLTETTRITTMWSYLEEDKPAFQNKERYKLAADGREPNTKGPFARLKLRRTGSFNVCDYL